MTTYKNTNFPRETLRLIVPRYKHCIVFIVHRKTFLKTKMDNSDI